LGYRKIGGASCDPDGLDAMLDTVAAARGGAPLPHEFSGGQRQPRARGDYISIANG
jgi:hypothetical protein